MDLIFALLIALGARHSAPAAYHAPVKTLPLVVQNDPAVIHEWHWGS
jgi:hypothetical protein